MEQIEMLSEQLPKASLLKLYVSQLHRVRKNLDLVQFMKSLSEETGTIDSKETLVSINQIRVITRQAKPRYQTRSTFFVIPWPHLNTRWV